MSVSTTTSPSLRIALAPAGAAGFDPGVPVLAGETEEHLFAGLAFEGTAGALQVYGNRDWRVGAAAVPLEAGLEAATGQVYDDLLAAVGDRRLVRIWNYVPAINADGPEGLENYRAFCRGRSLAFERAFGSDFKAHLPAASAVGCQHDRLTVVFAASRHPARHVENPLQVPAYDYPSDYGPRSPSFARATRVELAGHTAVFISGTSAVRGHATIAPESTLAQLDCTVENLRELSLACGLGPDLAARRGLRRHFKIYLRHASDLAAVQAALRDRLIRPGDEVSYVLSDICRAALNIEIEATLLPRG